MPIIYVLKLQGGKYYVGKSANPAHRIDQHKSGTGSEWTKLYPTEEIVDTVVQNMEFTELATTLKYMKKYGVDNVRGATYSTVTLTPSQKLEIENHIRGEYDLCFICGENTHFCTSCPNRPLSWYEYIRNWLCCFRKNTPTLDYTLIDDTDIIEFGKYKGRRYSEVFAKDKAYCNWVKNTSSSLSDFIKFKSWLKLQE